MHHNWIVQCAFSLMPDLAVARHAGMKYQVTVSRRGPQTYRVSLGQNYVDVVARKLNDGGLLVQVNPTEIFGSLRIGGMPPGHKQIQQYGDSLFGHSLDGVQNCMDCFRMTWQRVLEVHCRFAYWGFSPATSQQPAGCKWGWMDGT